MGAAMKQNAFGAGRPTVCVRAKNGYLRASNLSPDGSCSLPSCHSARESEIIGLLDVRTLLLLLSEIYGHVLRRASARTAEYLRQFLDPVLSASGIEIEGLGRRLIRDAHAEPDTIDALPQLADFNSQQLLKKQ